ncbi:MAG: carbohydrate ABC transporter permease [Candidatus Limnocylindria bacterium]
MVAAAQKMRRGRRLGGPSLASAETRAAYLFLLPWLAGLVFLLAIPLGWAAWISLTDEQLLRPGVWTGVDNYARMLSDDLFLTAVGVTLKWIVLSTPVFMIAGLGLALLLNQKLPGIRAFRTVLYIPAVLSGVAVAVLWVVLLNGDLGAVNQILRALGWSNPPNWFEDPGWAMPALVLMGLWGVGGGAIIYLAGLQNIPPHLYEAAEVDGAGPLSKFWNITLPMVSPTMFFVLINTIVDGLLVFGPIYVISSGAQTGGPANSLLFYMYYLYVKGFRDGELGYASALAWVLTVIGMVLVWLAFRLERRYVFYEAGGDA